MGGKKPRKKLKKEKARIIFFMDELWIEERL